MSREMLSIKGFLPAIREYRATRPEKQTTHNLEAAQDGRFSRVTTHTETFSGPGTAAQTYDRRRLRQVSEAAASGGVAAALLVDGVRNIIQGDVSVGVTELAGVVPAALVATERSIASFRSGNNRDAARGVVDRDWQDREPDAKQRLVTLTPVRRGQQGS